MQSQDINGAAKVAPTTKTNKTPIAALLVPLGGADSTRRRGGSPDVEVHLYADQVEPEDVLPLRETLNLNATATESTYSLKKRYGSRWLATLLAASDPDSEEKETEIKAEAFVKAITQPETPKLEPV